MDLALRTLALVLFTGFTSANQVELIPKMIRWPTHMDHYLCKQLHKGVGLRSHAVTNLNGDLCRTYCRVIDRIKGKITYTENLTPNFVRCGPYHARCVDGTCVGLNFPGGPNSQPSSPTITADNSGDSENVPEADATAEVSNNSDAHSPVEVAENSTATTANPEFTFPISSNLVSRYALSQANRLPVQVRY